MMDRYIGKRLDGRYEILELIGAGGMANVYRAMDVLEHKEYAVKILRDEFLENEEFVRRFKNESKAIAVLSHPNIVKVYDVSFTDRVQFIVMELVEGITLKDYIEQQHTIKWKECVHFTTQVLRALSHAHDRGIVHRDIKPQNIMLLPDGTIKVMDFGIARFARSETRTMTDKALGSVHYISPEQARGDVTDAKTDIYSVGVMMFEMLTGQLPFVADSPVSVAIKQISAQAKRPRELNTDIPEGLEEIVVRAMQKDASRRYRSAAEMLKDIDEFKKNPSIQFQYKYFTSESPTIYYDTQQVNKGAGRTDEHAQRGRTPAAGAARSGKAAKTDVAAEEIEYKSPVMPIMTGVAFAFIITAIVFVVYIFILNNPFAKVPDVEMPKFVGLRYDDIVGSEEYKEYGFQYNVTEDFNNDYAVGLIYEQTPTDGRMVKKGTVVNLKISKGIKEVTIPDLYNQDTLTAIAQLKALDILYDVQEIYSETYAEGRIVKTDPPKESTITTDTRVILYVSKGSESGTVVVPDGMVGMNIEDAKRVLETYGLKVGDVSPVESSLAAGTILAHDPEVNTEVDKNSVVNFTVSAGAGIAIERYNVTVTLPDIDKNVSLKAYVNDATVPKHAENLNPSEVGVWKPSFEGQGIIMIKVTINDKVYQEIQLDFARGTFRVVTDNSSQF